MKFLHCMEFTATSRNDCNLHLTNSVGHNVNDEKNDAITPANALLRIHKKETNEKKASISLHSVSRKVVWRKKIFYSLCQSN